MSSTVEHLGPQDAQALRAFLARDPAHNLYLLGLLEEFGVVPAPDRAHFAFYANVVGGEMTAAVFVGGDGGLVVPSSSDAADIGPIGERLADKVKLKACVGDKTAVDELVRRLCPHRPQFSRSQRLFAVSADDLGPFTNPTLRLATEADLPQLVPMAAGAVQEMLEIGRAHV